MSETIRHKFESTEGKVLTFTFRRDLLSQAKFNQLVTRFAPDESSSAVVFNFCWLAAHVIETRGAGWLPLRINVSEDEFWSALEQTLALFEDYEGFAAVVDQIPVNQLPVEDDPVKKPLEDLTDEQQAEIEEAKLIEAGGGDVPEKN